MRKLEQGKNLIYPVRAFRISNENFEKLKRFKIKQGKNSWNLAFEELFNKIHNPKLF